MKASIAVFNYAPQGYYLKVDVDNNTRFYLFPHLFGFLSFRREKRQNNITVSALFLYKFELNIKNSLIVIGFINIVNFWFSFAMVF